MSSGTTSAWLNPLKLHKAEDPFPDPVNGLPTEQDVLWFMCSPETYSLSKIIERYRALIGPEAGKLSMVPAEERILDRLIWPLHGAKTNYILGNYLGTIALCGMAAEMNSLLLFEIGDDSKKRIEFGKFERLGQEGRVKELRKTAVIDDKMHQLFSHIRVTRRKYLHLLSVDFSELVKDAATVYGQAVSLVAAVFGDQGVSNGAVVFHAQVIAYLQRKGLYKTDP